MRRRRTNYGSAVFGYTPLTADYGARTERATTTVARRGRRVVVQEWERGLLFRYGALVDTLEPGGYRYWRGGYATRAVDLRPWILTVPAQEVPTADGVSAKISVAGQIRVADASVYVSASQDASSALYLAVQVALRDAIAQHTVEQLLTMRTEIGQELAASVRGVDELGLALDRLEIKDIVLPPELKRARAAVLVARAEGLATLERARGETAALRGLANAARLTADNPALYQLRLLQQLAATVGHTVIIGTPPSIGAPHGNTDHSDGS